MMADALLVTAVVFTVKVAVVDWYGTTTLAGTVAEVLLLWSDTLMPPTGACPDNVTVAVEEFPLVTEVGLRVMELSCGAVSVRVAVLLTVL